MVVCHYMWPCDGLVNCPGCTPPSPIDTVAGIGSSSPAVHGEIKTMNEWLNSSPVVGRIPE